MFSVRWGLWKRWAGTDTHTHGTCTADRFPGITTRRRNASSVLATTAGECLSYQLCRVRPISCNESRSPLHSPSCDDPCTRCLSQPTTSSRSHTISLYSLAHCLALSRSHAESRSLSHQLPHGTWYHPLSTSHTVSLYPECIRLTVCRATGQPSVQRTDVEPRTVRRTTAAHNSRARSGVLDRYCLARVPELRIGRSGDSGERVGHAIGGGGRLGHVLRRKGWFYFARWKTISYININLSLLVH